MLYRVVDAVDRLSEKEKGFKVGVINKVSINAIDEDTMNLVSPFSHILFPSPGPNLSVLTVRMPPPQIGNSKFVLVAESWNEKTGLGARVSRQLLAEHCSRGNFGN